jgi:hypothetical protein
MSTASQAKRKTKAFHLATARFGRIGPSDEEIRYRQRGVREFILAMSAELATLAYENHLESLAVIFHTACEVANEDVVGQAGSGRSQRTASARSALR